MYYLKRKKFKKNVEKKIKSDFSTVNSRCLCNFKTVWFSEKQLICQSAEKKYNIKKDFNDFDTDVNFEHACLNLSQSLLINEDVCLKIEEKTVWDITNLTRMMMRFCRSFVQWWSEMSWNDFNWWVNKTAQDEICWSDMNVMNQHLNDKKKEEWAQNENKYLETLTRMLFRKCNTTNLIWWEKKIYIYIELNFSSLWIETWCHFCEILNCIMWLM